MTVDLVGPAAGGATGALVTLFAKKGVDWLLTLVASHSAPVQAKIQANTQNFIYRLAQRVQRLEAELPVSQVHLISDAFDHPATSLMLQKSLVSAAVTDNDDRHAILAELIAQRLTAGADDMIALAGGAACDIVGSLSSKQIHLLALMATLFEIRPNELPEKFPSERLDKLVLAWWDKQMTAICTDELEGIRGLDFAHLEALSCIRISIGQKDLQSTLNLRIKGETLVAQMSELQQFGWWPRLDQLWSTGIKNCTPTSVGILIGTLHHDTLTKARTLIDRTEATEEKK